MAPRHAVPAVLILAGSLAIPGAQAQTLSESTITARISQSIEADTNYDLDENSPGTTYFGDTRFSLGVLQESETQRLRFDLSTGLRPIKRPDEDFDLNVATPSLARFAFAQDFANSAFDIDVSARVNRTNRLIADETFTDDPGIPILEDVDLIRDDTFRQNYRLNTGFAFGTNAPSTIDFRLRATAVDYTGENADDFTARSAAEAELLWTLRVNPVLSGALLAGYFYEDADNPEDSQIEIAEFDLGFVYEPTERLRAVGGLGYANRQRRETIGGVRETTDDNSGIVIRANADYETEDLVFGFNARYTTAAPSPRLSGDIFTVYSQPRSTVRARLFQTFGFGSDLGDERRVTGAGLGYGYTLNSFSSIGLDLTAANSETAEEVGGTPDRNRVDFTARYSRTITSVVDASLGYRLRQRFDDPTDAVSHRVFFEIGRSFTTGL